MKENWPYNNLEQVKHCPLCKQSDRRLLYTGLSDRTFFCAPGSWALYGCNGCNSAYLDPRPDAESIHLAYINYGTHVEFAQEGTVPKNKLNYLRLALTNGYLNQRWGYKRKPSYSIGFLSSYLSPMRRSRQDSLVRNLPYPSTTRRLLDIGCANGEFISHMQASGWEAEGLEVDPVTVEIARKAGLMVHQGMLTGTTFAANYFDAITMSHVIEHLHDPLGVLQNCYNILRPGGKLWIATPNLDSLGHNLFGINWLHLDPPRHLTLFNLTSLTEILKRVGFEVAEKNLFRAMAAHSFRASAAIANGKEPINNPPPLDLRLRSRAFFSNLRALLQPNLAEELILLVKKPEIPK